MHLQIDCRLILADRTFPREKSSGSVAIIGEDINSPHLFLLNGVPNFNSKGIENKKLDFKDYCFLYF